MEDYKLIANKPVISVICAVYNGEKYIKETVDSILNQTFTNFELIIVNDASTDNTINILTQLQRIDSRIIIINNNKNRFVIQSRNIGIKKARGKYIAVTDADDVSLPNRLKIQYQFLDENKNIFCVCSNYLRFFDYNDELLKIVEPAGFEYISKNLINNNTINHSTVMFLNSEVYYREKMYYTEDYDLFLRMLSNKQKIYNLPNLLLKHRIRKNSLSRKGNDSNFIKWIFILICRKFYLQRVKTGKDNYSRLNPNEIFNILNNNYSKSKFTLYYSLLTALKTKSWKELIFIIKSQLKFNE